MEIPETMYATPADGVHLAYQVVGQGSQDLVFAWGLLTSIDSAWEIPEVAD